MKKGRGISIPEKRSRVMLEIKIDLYWCWQQVFLTDTNITRLIAFICFWHKRALQVRIRVNTETQCCSMSFLYVSDALLSKGIRRHLLMSCTCFWLTWLPSNTSRNAMKRYCVKRGSASHLLPARISKTSTELDVRREMTKPMSAIPTHPSFYLTQGISPRKEYMEMLRLDDCHHFDPDQQSL